LAEIVNPKLLLYVGYSRHHAFKAFFAEKLVFLFLEILAERIVFIARNNLN
jgi:hypothetical protein